MTNIQYKNRLFLMSMEMIHLLCAKSVVGQHKTIEKRVVAIKETEWILILNFRR